MHSPLIYILSDYKSLDLYYIGDKPSFSTIKSNLFLLHRDFNKKVPDHYYKARQIAALDGVNNLSDLIINSFNFVSNKYFIFDSGTRCPILINDRFTEWQNIITYLPPLLVQSFLISTKENAINNPKKFYKDYLVKNFKYTAIPQPNFPELNKIREKHNGFSDLHIHLNGSVETDNVWEDFLRSPDKIYSDLKMAFHKELVKEHFEQDSHLLSPYKFYRFLVGASNIRHVLFELICTPTSKSAKKMQELSANRIISEKIFSDYLFSGYSSGKNPFELLLDEPNTDPTSISVEALMYCIVFNHIIDKKNHYELVTTVFHIYILIKGLANKLLVQQEVQYGFDQFQKHTFNKLRDFNELTYHQRFYQMDGNESSNLRFIEGRFAPKNSESDNVTIIEAVRKGWNHFMQDKTQKEMRLVAHIIKLADDDKSYDIRFKSMRVLIFKQMSILDKLLKKPPYSELVTAIDAAANELHTPPEVFGPIFRKMRRSNSNLKFTYHVGEDFCHPISGIRAIYEAIEFLNFKKDDRLGHATVLGIDWEQWKGNMEETSFIKMGEWLDNAVFLIYFIENRRLKSCYSILSYLKSVYKSLSFEIFNEVFDFNDYVESWFNRKYCPLLYFVTDYKKAINEPTFDEDEWEELKAIRVNANAKRIIEKYNQKQYRDRYNKFPSKTFDEFLDSAILKNIQLEMLEVLNDRCLVIETLPTSNVRISQYKDHSEHHLYRWLKWKEIGKSIPEFVIGADDTGIFATNIYNEYAHVFNQINTKKEFDDPAINYIENLIITANKYLP